MASHPGEKGWQEYIDLNSRRSVPIIRDKGFSVWSVIGYFRVCGENESRVLADYRGELTAEELNAALAYYREHPEGIDEKLWELAN